MTYSGSGCWPESSGLEGTVRRIRWIVYIGQVTNWWGRDYNFGLPSFPWVNGRDFAGIVVKTGKGVLRVKHGDVVSTPNIRNEGKLVD